MKRAIKKEEQRLLYKGGGYKRDKGNFCEGPVRTEGRTVRNYERA